MNLFELFVKIGVDDQASDKVGKIAEKLGNGLKTAAKVGTAAVAGTSAAIVALGKQAIDQYSEYEQLVGGVETLFGTAGLSLEEYAKKEKKTVAQVEKEYKSLERAQSTALKNASTAYKTAGMSANNYMSTVTSFAASLIQSLEGDTEAAVAAADLAITDMSDNANKMGTDMSLIQNAYQGFAKANYTMLDNLKLGYGGTQTEMQRLIKDAAALSDTVDAQSMSFANIVEAIHVVQTEMGITGTTAKEAGATISGSVASMKAAWQNMLVGIADDNADFETLIDNFVVSIAGDGTEANKGVVGNLLPRIETTLGGIGQVVKDLAPIIRDDALPYLVTEVLPGVTSAAGSLVNTLIDGINTNATDLLSTGTTILTNFASGVTTKLEDGSIQGATDSIIDAAVNFLTNEDGKLTEFGDAAEKLVTALGGYIKNTATSIHEGAAEVVTAFLNYIKSEEFKEEMDDAADEFNKKLANALGKADAKIKESAKELGKKALEAFKDGFSFHSIYDFMMGLETESMSAEMQRDRIRERGEETGRYTASYEELMVSVFGESLGSIPEQSDESKVFWYEYNKAKREAELLAEMESVPEEERPYYLSKKAFENGTAVPESPDRIPATQVSITQHIYSQAQTAADLAEATLYEAERGILSDVPR